MNQTCFLLLRRRLMLQYVFLKPIEFTTKLFYYRYTWVNDSVGWPHEHDGYLPSYIREFHVLVRNSCILCKATLHGIGGGYFAVRFPS